MKVAFVCLGNICRSPMAELVFRKMVNDFGAGDRVEVTSCGTSSCEAGSSIYPSAAEMLKRHGVPGSHTARKITGADLEECDYILCMDSDNLESLKRIATPSQRAKIYMLCSFTPNPRDVADPWYTRNFERAYRDIEEGCRCFLGYLKEEKLI